MRRPSLAHLAECLGRCPVYCSVFVTQQWDELGRMRSAGIALLVVTLLLALIASRTSSGSSGAAHLGDGRAKVDADR